MNVFELWNIVKINLHDDNYGKVYVKERDVFFIKMGKNVGDEQDGKGNNFARPVVIIKVFNKNLFWGVPLTTKKKQGKYYVPITLNGKQRVSIISQMRLFDTKRVMEKKGRISNEEFHSLKNTIKNLL